MPVKPSSCWRAALAHHSISRHSLAIAVLAVSLAGCASPDFPEQVERPADKLYDEALSLVLQGDAEKAAPQFEEVERQHPYSDLAVRAQIMAAWSFYQDNNYPACRCCAGQIHRTQSG